MEISGTQKVKASRPEVFNALLNPEVLKNSFPGCDSAEFVDFPSGRQLKLIISPNVPGFKGPYNVFLQNGTASVAASLPPVADQWSRLVYIAEPTSSFGSIKATCIIDLTDDPAGTLLTYKADAEVSGKVAGIPDMVVNGAVKMALGQFFKNFEKQVSTANV